MQPQVVETPSITSSASPKLRIVNSLRRVFPGWALPKSKLSGSTRMRGAAAGFSSAPSAHRDERRHREGREAPPHRPPPAARARLFFFAVRRRPYASSISLS